MSVIARLNVGGPAQQVAVMSEGLDPGRFEHRIVAGTPGPREGDYVALRAPDLDVRLIPGLGRAPRPQDDARALFDLIRLMRDFRPHVVHTHTAKAGFLGRLAARWCRVPATVHTHHGHLLHGYFSRPVRAAIVQAERRLARHTTRLLAVGEQVRDDLLAAGIGRPDQYDVVAPGVRLGQLPPGPVARASLGVPSDARVASLVARLTAIKRPERFVHLAAAVARRHRDALFIVAGDGEMSEGLKRLAASLAAPVKFLGWRADVEAVYAASDVVVLTSDNEGMPVSLIEASLAGRPCVTTRAGSAPEVVINGESGFVVSTTDVKELSRAVELLLEDDLLRAQMGAAAAERAKRRFGAERLVSDLTAVYESVCDGNHTGAGGVALAGVP